MLSHLLFWPLALWVAWKYKQNLLFVYLLFFAASFSLSIGSTRTHPTELFFWPFGRFWEFLAGSILAWLIPHGENILKTTNSHPHTLSQYIALKVHASNRHGITTLLGLIFLVGSVALISKQDPFPYYLAAYPVLGTFLVILGGSSNPFSRILLSNRLATWLGLISYPLYLWHWPLLSYLHIMKDGSPHRDSIISVVALSFLLAWITFRFFEKPLRQRTAKTPLTVALLMAVFIIGVIGLTVSLWDFKASKGVYFREGLEHQIGSSNQWYEGEDGWFFLGNAHDGTIEKLKLSKAPSSNEINLLKNTFEDIAIIAQKSNTQLALIVGPNKSSIYADQLPPSIPVSSTRYVDFFLNSLRSLPGLTVYDPTNDLKKAKHSSGLLYYRTDTHWNDKGAYIAFKNLLSKLKLEAPEVSFTLHKSTPGDLIKISKLKEYPLVHDDTWLAKIQHIQQVTRTKHPESSQSDAFGESETVTNRTPLINKKVWVVGDSFSAALRPYLEATFSEVSYLGHWSKWSHRLASFLDDSPHKPDIIIIVQVERAF